MFGSSWMTAVVGYLVIVIAAVQQVLQDDPIPHTWYDWISFVGKVLVGVGIALSKQFNVSHAPEPNPVAAPAVKSPTT